MIAKLDLSSNEFAAMAVWLNSKDNGWRKYFLAQDKPVFQPKLVRLLKTRGDRSGHQEVELEIPNFLSADLTGTNIQIMYYEQHDVCLWLGDEGRLPRHLRADGNSIFLIDPTPLIESMFGAIVAGR